MRHATKIAGITLLFLIGIHMITWLPNWNIRWTEGYKQIVSERLQFTDLFLYFHRQPSVTTFEGRQVILLDIHDFQTREQVAELLDSIASAQPYLVALDVIFGNTSMPDTAVNRRLTESIRKLPNLILAIEQRSIDGQTFHLERSFFADEVQATEAIVNLPTTVVRSWQPTQIYGKDTFPTFAYAILEQMGVPIPDRNTQWLIDYSLVDSVVIRPDIHSFPWTFLRNQVILIGDTRDLRDLRSVPFTMGTSARIAGVQVHKQIIQTAAAQHWFCKLSEVWTWLITFVFLWLLLMIKPWVEKIPIAPRLPQEKIQKSLKKTLRLLLFLVTLGFAYLLFWGANRYFNILMVVVEAPAMLWLGEWLFGLGQSTVWTLSHLYHQRKQKS